MKKKNVIVSVFLSTILCVGSCVPVIAEADNTIQFQQDEIVENEKITDLEIIKKMISEYIEQTGLPSGIADLGKDLEKQFGVMFVLDAHYWNGVDVKPYIEKFCNENNIDYSKVRYYVLVSSNSDNSVKDEYAVSEDIEPSKYGDVTSSESVDVADLVKLNQYLTNSEKYPLTDVQKANADCYKDGVIDAKDCTTIMNYLSLIIEEEELGK